MGMIFVIVLLYASAASTEPEVAPDCARGWDCSKSNYVEQLENLFSEIISRAEIGRMKTTLVHECRGADTSHTTIQTLSAQIVNLTEQITDVVSKGEVCEGQILDLRSTVTSELDQFQQLLRNINATTEQEIRRLDGTLSALQNNIHMENQLDDCPSGFATLSGFSASCYRFVTSAMTWSDADQFCRESTRGAHLAVVDTPEEDHVIIDHLKSIQMNGVYISGQTLDPNNCSSPYHWKPFPGIQIPVNYTNWSAGEPNCHNNTQNCLQYLRFKWDDVHCLAKRGFVCEFDRSKELMMMIISAMNQDAESNRQMAEHAKNTIADFKVEIEALQNQSKQENAVLAAKLSMPACPQDFFRLPGYMGSSCYRMINEPANWEEAGFKCRSLARGSHLIVVEDETENLAVVQYLLSMKDALPARCSQSSGSFWTSGQMLTRGNCSSGYVWKPYPTVNVPMNFTNWAPGQPHCEPAANYESVQLWRNRYFEWDDQDYYYKMCSMCEYDNLYG